MFFPLLSNKNHIIGVLCKFYYDQYNYIANTSTERRLGKQPEETAV